MLLAEVTHFLQSEQPRCFPACIVFVIANDVCLAVETSRQTLHRLARSMFLWLHLTPLLLLLVDRHTCGTCCIAMVSRLTPTLCGLEMVVIAQQLLAERKNAVEKWLTSGTGCEWRSKTQLGVYKMSSRCHKNLDKRYHSSDTNEYKLTSWIWSDIRLLWDSVV